MIVRVLCQSPGAERHARRLRRRAARFLKAMGREDAELSVVVTSDARIRTLNRRWRGKDRATDVLSFPISEPAGAGSLLGDVVISLETAARRALAGGPVAGELDRYLAHGLLHLLGYDHRRAGDARAMAEEEERLTRAVGLVGAALEGTGPRGPGAGDEARWTRTRTSISTPSRSGSTGPGTRARSWRGASRR